MKLGPVTIIAKTNKTTSKKIDDDLMSENCDTNVSRTGGVNLTPPPQKELLKSPPRLELRNFQTYPLDHSFFI